MPAPLSVILPAPLSVILPAHDAAEHISDQLEALGRQDPAVVGEIVVVNNRSRDRTGAIARAAAAGDPRIRVIDADGGRGAGYARNVGAAVARGEWLAFCDADDIVTPAWATTLLACARSTGTEFVAGRNDHDTLQDGGRRRWPAAIHPPDRRGRERARAFAEGGNLAISARAFAAIGGFDESLRFAAEDVDLSWRLERAGVRLTRCADAVVLCRDPVTLPAALRQAYRYGRGNHGLWHAGGGRDGRGGHDGRGGRRGGRSGGRPRPWLAAGRVLARAPLAPWSLRRRAVWARQLAFWIGYLIDALAAERRTQL